LPQPRSATNSWLLIQKHICHDKKYATANSFTLISDHSEVNKSAAMGIGRLFFVSRALIAGAMILLSFELHVAAADKPDLTDTNLTRSAPEISFEAQQALRSYIQLQEQVHQAILSIEETRKEAQATAKQNAELITAQLKMLEQAVTLQRSREAESARSSSRFALIVAGSLGALGLLVMGLTAWFLMKTAKQFSASASLAPAPGLSHTVMGLLGEPTGSLPSAAAEESGIKLLGAIERLEKRIRQIEHGEPKKLTNHSADHGETNGAGEPAERSEVTLLLGKGQSLLHLNQTDEAIHCFNEALALDPTNTEALLKKGTALERLKRLEDAVECYDRAIAVDDSITLAYLYKGGVFNQLERFGEALQCYEKALRTQQKVAVN
jgi:tetratricopeptide (TPR) repeat protein